MNNAAPTTRSSAAVPEVRKAEARKQLFADIEALIPRLRERATQTREQRYVPEETVRELKEMNFFRILQPGAYEGLELNPQDFCQAIIRLATGCMSTAWICGVIGVHPFQLALFDRQAQEDVWADDVDCLVSSSYAPMGKVTRRDGGFDFSGRWGWSSGCNHCRWVLLGGIVPEEGYRTFLVPLGDYRIEDTWHVMGLQGTGSNDIIIDGAFVPEYRTHRQIDGFSGSNPSAGLYEAPLFRLPWGQIFVRAVATAQIGGLKRALELFIANAVTGKSSGDLSKHSADPAVKALVAETATTVAELEAVLMRNFDSMMEHLRRDEPVPMELRIRSRYQASLVTDRTLEAVSKLFSFAGGRSVFLVHEIQQIFLDIRTSRAHVANNPTLFARNYGATLLGEDNTDFFL